MTRWPPDSVHKAVCLDRRPSTVATGGLPVSASMRCGWARRFEVFHVKPRADVPRETRQLTQVWNQRPADPASRAASILSRLSSPSRCEVNFPESFDVIVVGGGHAGTEAALAAARTGARTLLLTHNIETLGQMSCNPSIGGIGKGHLVREVDALGGAMAAATDEAGIQFRILNRSKGPAVRATRAQADRVLYRKAIRRRLENQPNLWLFQQAVDDLLVEGERVAGAVTQSGIRFRATAVVLTAGTFLNGLIHIGLQNFSAGRAGDPPSISLAARLKELQLPQGRLKTGTPPRIDGRTIDYSRLEEQPGDLDPMPVFSFLGSAAPASATGAVLDHAHECAYARGDPRQPRPQPDVLGCHRGRRAALLPIDRRQDPSFRRQGLAPDLSRAGGPGHP